ncbi:MAG: hypothetical protein ACREP6_12810 [Candidatus Binataceae bacterium]
MKLQETASADGGAPARHEHAQVIPSALARLPIHFFVVGVLSLACFGAGAIAVMPAAVRFFYQPHVLALVHTLTLGVITAVIMGVMYRYVPALLHRPIRFPWLARAQFPLFVAGSIGMIGHFAVGNWMGLWWSATAVLVSVVMFAACLLPVLWDGLWNAVAETGMFLAICCLLCAGALGLTMGLEEAYGFMWGDLPRMLGAHVVFAAIGWVTLTICAASYRFIPAFVLPTIELPPAALRQIQALALTVAGLALTLLFGAAGVTLWAAAVGLSLIAYLAILSRVIRSRRIELDWKIRHVQAGAVWLALAVALGIVVAWRGAWSPEGAGWAAALGAAGLLGWIVNFIIGMSYQLFPGFVSRVRTALGWPAVAIAELSVPRIRPSVFALYNAGVILIVIAFLTSSPALARWGSILLAGGALLYSAAALWTLSFAYRRSAPESARRALRVLGAAEKRHGR